MQKTTGRVQESGWDRKQSLMTLSTAVNIQDHMTRKK